MTSASRSRSCDVAVAGGGPAGSVTALILARLGLEVLLIDGSAADEVRIGETLPPAARQVLARLGLEDAIAWPSAIPSYGNASAWGESEVRRSSFLFHPHGPGWHLDRRRFDARLCAAAEDAGARVVRGRRATSASRCEDGSWRLMLEGNADPVRAAAVIDAGGRQARLSRALGGHRRVHDHLVGVAVSYRGRTEDGGHTLVEAERDGWWYSAQLPGRAMIVVYVTDADLCRSGRVAEPETFSRRIARADETARHVGGREPCSAPFVTSAITHRLQRDQAGGRWLATGDAAMGVDPLSASGILNALRSGEWAAHAMCNWLLGRPQAAVEYERELDAMFTEYSDERRTIYGRERRWAQTPFWSRRGKL